MARKQQILMIHIKQEIRNGYACTGVKQSFESPRRSLRLPFFHALAQQPHAIYVLEEISLAAYAALIAEILAPRTLGDMGGVQYAADQRPRPGTDEGPVIALGWNSCNGGGS